MKLIWHTLALNDFEQIISYCHHCFGKQTAQKIRDKYRKDISSLKDQPHLGFVEPALKNTGTLEYRSLLIKYTKVIYTVHTEHIFIHLLWDCRQKPKTLNSEIEKRDE